MVRFEFRNILLYTRLHLQPLNVRVKLSPVKPFSIHRQKGGSGSAGLTRWNLNIFLLIVILFFPASGSSQTYPDPTVDSTLKCGINEIILQDYASAEQTFTNLDRTRPELPLGKIYLAAVKIARSYDYGEDYDEPVIDSLLELAGEQSNSLFATNKTNPWNKYFISLTEGYLAYFKALNGEWLSSLSSGADALSDFSELASVDTNFYEAYIAIGTYKYWKSRKTEFFDWIPGYIDEKEEGIRLLEKAVRHPTYNTYLAVNSLIWIYIDQKKYNKAVNLAEKVLKEYPGSRFFEWGLARAYEEINRYKAIGVYKKILVSLPENMNHYNEIILKHLIAQQYSALDEKQEALRLCDEILSTRLSSDVSSKLEARLHRVEALKEHLSK